MARFRKKPVVIEAYQIEQPMPDETLRWLMANSKDRPLTIEDDHLLIETLEGAHRGDIGDWVICGVAGELYPCKPEIFAATYELVEE